MILTFTKLLIGFSVIAAAILLGAYLFALRDLQKSRLGQVACAVLLIGLSALQLEHLRFLETGADLFATRHYVMLLIAIPPAFYFFSRELLLPESGTSPWQWLHLAPFAAAFFVPADIVATIAFVIGAGYCLWFAQFVWGMRRERKGFRFEMFFFGLFAVLAVAVLMLRIAGPYVDDAVFYLSYAHFTGIALVLVTSAMIVFPEMLGDFSEAAKRAYQTSTLNDVDVDGKLAKLDSLMCDDKIYQNESLSLALLAEAVGLSGHQLSELINTRFGYGFSRYVREQRVAEAKKLLETDDRSSILAISLSTGFRSQSNFYAAFREITGEAPGSYRKRLQR